MAWVVLDAGRWRVRVVREMSSMRGSESLVSSSVLVGVVVVKKEDGGGGTEG